MNKELEIASGENLLDAMLAAGYRVPYACRNGCCHVCMASWQSGDPCDAARLPDRDGDKPLLLCLAQPTTDIEIIMPNLQEANTLEPTEIACQVSSVTLMGGQVYRVELMAPAGTPPAFYAGQYLQLLIPGNDSAFFSIANAPGSREIELHVQVNPGREKAESILAYLQKEPLVRVRLPMGKANVNRLPEGDVVLAAAGTGFAQIKSIYEWLQAEGFAHNTHVFWGVRKISEFYDLSLISRWEQESGTTCHTVSGDLNDNEWQGHHHELLRLVDTADIDWAQASVYASGSPAMVYALSDLVEAKGAKTERLFSDVFEYAPRES